MHRYNLYNCVDTAPIDICTYVSHVCSAPCTPVSHDQTANTQPSYDALSKSMDSLTCTHCTAQHARTDVHDTFSDVNTIHIISIPCATTHVYHRTKYMIRIQTYATLCKRGTWPYRTRPRLWKYSRAPTCDVPYATKRV